MPTVRSFVPSERAYTYTHTHAHTRVQTQVRERRDVYAHSFEPRILQEEKPGAELEEEEEEGGRGRRGGEGQRVPANIGERIKTPTCGA